MDSKRKLSATDCEKITRLLESGVLDNIQLALSLLEQTADHDDIVKIFHLGVIVDLVCLDQPEDVEAMIHVGHFLQKKCPQAWQRFTEAVVDDQLLTSQFYEQPPQNKYSDFGQRAISSAVAGKLALDQWSDYVERVGFNRLECLTAGQAKGLIQFSGKLTFNSIAELTDATAEILSQHKGELSLRALENVSESAIRSLSQHANLKVSKKTDAKIKAYISSEKAKARKLKKSGQSVLTKQQITKIRQMLRGKTSDQTRMAIELVGMAGASADDVVDIFSTSIISLLVNTWDIDVWNALAPLFEKHVCPREEFSNLVDQRFLKKSSGSRASIITSLFSQAEMPLVPLIKTSRILGDAPKDWQTNIRELSDAGALLFVTSCQKARVNSAWLCNLTSLTGAAAKRLGEHCNEWALDLSGLTSLSDAAAECLSKHRGDLGLSGLTRLSDAAAESLSKHRSGPLRVEPVHLDLSGLTSLSDAAAECLSKHQGYLDLSRLTSLSDSAAESLSKHQGGLDLTHLRSLSDVAAKSLRNYQGHLRAIRVAWEIRRGPR